MEVTSLLIGIALAVLVVFISIVLLHQLAADFLKRHEHSVNAFIYLTGAIFALGGLLFTGLQIQQGARQLEASTVYAVQRDFRELFGSAVRSRAYRAYVLGFSQNAEYEPEVIEEAVGYISQVMQLYSAMFITRSYGLISDEAWRIAHLDLCLYLEAVPVRDAWVNRFRSTYERTLPEFVREVERC